MEILFDGSDSVINMRPWPERPEPIHSEMAPFPFAGPLKVLFILGSSRSWGAHRRQVPRLSMRIKTFSGGASILTDRWMRKIFGLVAARTRIVESKTAKPIMSFTIMTLSLVPPSDLPLAFALEVEQRVGVIGRSAAGPNPCVSA